MVFRRRVGVFIGLADDRALVVIFELAARWLRAEASDEAAGQRFARGIYELQPLYVALGWAGAVCIDAPQ